MVGVLDDGYSCEDASNAIWDETLQTLILVAADGAGEAKNAASGSKNAVDEVSRLAPSLLAGSQADLDEPSFLESLLIELARSVRERLEAAADQSDDRNSGGWTVQKPFPSPLHSYATTLLVVIQTPKHLGALQVGDGFIVFTTNQSSMQRVFEPSQGRYSNQTCFLTSFSSFDELLANRQVQVSVHPRVGICSVALITDGLENVAMNMRGGTPHPRSFWR